MTDDVKELLQQYGILVVSLSQLAKERPGSQYESLGEYYKSLGGLLPDEPALVVRISKDREIRFLHEGEHDVSIADSAGQKTGKITVWELPEDEYWFFRAFRPALFGLEKALPGFVFEMGITYAYALFEGYLSEILRRRMRQQPRLMSSQRELKYDQVFLATSKEALIESMIDREMRDLLYLSVLDLLKKMRDKMGFASLSVEWDEKVNYISLVRNCLLHNRGQVDARLASVQPTVQAGDRLSIGELDVSTAVNTLRSLAFQIDELFEKMGPA
jgi:hypothetical protein